MDTASPAEFADTKPQGSSSSSLIVLALAVLIGGAFFLYFYFQRRGRMSHFATPTPATLGPTGASPFGAILPTTENGYRFETAPGVRHAYAYGDDFGTGAPTDVIVLPRPDDGMPASSPLAENVGYWQDVMIPSSTAGAVRAHDVERPFSPIIELRFVSDGEAVDPPNHEILLPATSEIDVVDLRLG